MTSAARLFADAAAGRLTDEAAEQETGLRVLEALDFGVEAVLVARVLPGRAVVGFAVDAERFSEGFDSPETAGEAWSWEIREPGKTAAWPPSPEARAAVEARFPRMRWITFNTPPGTFIDGT